MSSQQKRQRIIPQNQPGRSVFSQFETEPENHCGLCDGIFATKYMLGQHLSTVHRMSEVYINSYLRSAEQRELSAAANEEEQDEDDFELDFNDSEVEEENEDTDRLLEQLVNYRIQTLQGLFNQNVEGIQNAESAFPFKNIEAMILHVLLLLIVSEEAFRKNERVVLPTLNKLMHYQNQVRNQIPVFPSKSVILKNDNNASVEGCVNLPSDHLKLMASNPRKSVRIFSAPDRTPNQSVSLQQGKKWKENPCFQQPMTTVDDFDYWSGDIALIQAGNRSIYLLIESFHTECNNLFVQDYQVIIYPNDSRTFIKENCIKMRASQLIQLVQVDRANLAIGLDIFNGMMQLSTYHLNLFTIMHPLRKLAANQPGKYYKVRISPIILFTDDTSGNKSKQFNAYESWSMRCASMTFKERSSLENMHFIGAVQKKEGISGVSLIPCLVEDLVKLENGVVMYSAVDNEDVLVVAPVLWIEADSPCHSQLCGLYGLRTKCPCRKCYVDLSRGAEARQRTRSYYTGDHCQRVRSHYVTAASTSDRSSVILDAPKAGESSVAKVLSFKDTNTSALLQLKSFDPQQDTPTEILHTVLLGVSKYLITDLVKIIATKAQLTKITTALDHYKHSKGFSRKLSRKLQHVGSFLGRDFKVLLQILPVILVAEFPDATGNLKYMIPCFVQLGKLCSLLFVKQVPQGFNHYVEVVGQVSRELVAILYDYDQNCTHIKHVKYHLKPKTHFLTHLSQDIKRFGAALNFETEKGEQFNKHIREHIEHTNKAEVPRQLAVKFGKQAAMRHVVDGGSWLTQDGFRVKTGQRVLNFVDTHAQDFYQHFFGGTRDFVDNNDYQNDNIKVCNGLFALFKQIQHPSLLQVGVYVDGFMQVYQVQPASANDRLTNVLRALPTRELIDYRQVRLECLLDMHTRLDNYQLINLSKFGIYWYFKYYTNFLSN
ncbi:hypothetical protein BD560DRAFT_487811 [Blakeslea trispora]|nr:hypothetical protein BD560DRAFT_487811 [Blakeslea trispora]